MGIRVVEGILAGIWYLTAIFGSVGLDDPNFLGLMWSSRYLEKANPTLDLSMQLHGSLSVCTSTL